MLSGVYAGIIDVYLSFQSAWLKEFPPWIWQMCISCSFVAVAAVPDGSWDFSSVKSDKLNNESWVVTLSSVFSLTPKSLWLSYSQPTSHHTRMTAVAVLETVVTVGVTVGVTVVALAVGIARIHRWADGLELQFVKGNFVCQPYADAKKSPIFFPCEWWRDVIWAGRKGWWLAR